jgi:hypothetical protein
MSRKIDVYTIEELKEQFPDAYDKAYEEFKKDTSSDPYLLWQEEIMGSMKATFKHAGVTLHDWSIGAYSPSYVKFSIPTYWSELAEEDLLVDDYEGKLAYKWLKDAFDLKSYKRVAYKNHLGKTAYRHDFKKLDGKDWSCEFTGVCFDHDYLESLFECIHDGMNLKDAFSNLADEARKLFENEYEYQQSEEYFLEEASNNDYEYTEKGDKI